MLTERTAWTLSSNIVTNLKEHVKAIILRSGRTYDQSVKTKRDEEAAKNLESEKEEIEDKVTETNREATEQQAEKTRENKGAAKSKKYREFIYETYSPSIYNPPIPCPQRLRKNKIDNQLSLQLATEESSAIVKKKLPPKKLGLGEAKPTIISLQLVDKSIKYPRALIEDALVKVNKFILLTDFILLDMEEDKEIPLIPGRPFLATGRTLIDVQKEKLILRVGEEKVTYEVFNIWKSLSRYILVLK
ncbi:uncharacterized protein LOC121245791 [Juglans microcarpa x Juglans regia]|uniref:uncharacterized protein LOC121245791 n=1 Tax=Juglans microcarpa x Juglans regia TaxID=2249226 RepID=UPI001B7EF3D1|nr:uncharacterized protein LOC121245791 [Juglans microcarpa x Juglans regia]